MVSGREGGLSRRQLIVSTTAAGLGAAVPVAVAGQASPVASPAGIDEAGLHRLSQAIVGGGTLADEAVPALAELLAAEPGIGAALNELADIGDMTPEALQTASAEAQAVAKNILTYWYQGQYNGEPVQNREAIFFQLASWQALPYMTQPTLCKAFGYWAADVMPS